MIIREIDLHTHSYYSDGSYSPAEILQQAKDLNLVAISITDHDALEGISEAINVGKDLDIEVIPGIEINVELMIQKIISL